MSNNQLKKFKSESMERVDSYNNNLELQEVRWKLFKEMNKIKYFYNFFWLGVPIIQSPQDMQALQEIIWDVKPDLIIETGIAWGGSILFSASMLKLLETCGEIEKGDVIGIDIDIRSHTRELITTHPMSKNITMLEGSSIDSKMVKKIANLAKNKKRVLIILDSNHTHDHVLAELKIYAPLVSLGSYIIAQDTIIEDLPTEYILNRHWSKGNNPKTAVWEFLKQNDNFKIDKIIESKIMLTNSPDGFLKRIK
ncbi:cephalosporin hydroxylase family protein [Patescibacteria group bacterium]|nr:cephalosporin hydroxylase family protein [Patescibacteria group bacterium]MBU4482296.1 cephalosporin hydroxylase family protein [Patescibacteria group bacterium]